MKSTYTAGKPDVRACVDQAAVRLYDAECALHIARQTRVDLWINAAADHLHEHGLLALEHGSGQASEVAALFERHGFINIRTRADRSGLPRVTLANIHSHPKGPS